MFGKESKLANITLQESFVYTKIITLDCLLKLLGIQPVQFLAPNTTFSSTK
jgi:hypothetical protein